MKKRTYIILLTVFAVFIAPVLLLGWILQTISTLLSILGHLCCMEDPDLQCTDDMRSDHTNVIYKEIKNQNR